MKVKQQWCAVCNGWFDHGTWQHSEQEILSDAKTVSVIPRRMEYWLQEQRPPDVNWIDYGPKETAKDAFTRIEELKTEKPTRTFRCIARYTEDRILSP